MKFHEEVVQKVDSFRHTSLMEKVKLTLAAREYSSTYSRSLNGKTPYLLPLFIQVLKNFDMENLDDRPPAGSPSQAGSTYPLPGRPRTGPPPIMTNATSFVTRHFVTIMSGDFSFVVFFSMVFDLQVPHQN